MNTHLTRRDNLLALYAAHVAQAQADDPAASLSGLDKSFAQCLQIANSSFSSYKSGARPIGTRIARQVEVLLGLEHGWLDEPHGGPMVASADKHQKQFLKLAEKFYKRSSEAQREMVADIFLLALRN